MSSEKFEQPKTSLHKLKLVCSATKARIGYGHSLRQFIMSSEYLKGVDQPAPISYINVPFFFAFISKYMLFEAALKKPDLHA